MGNLSVLLNEYWLLADDLFKGDFKMVVLSTQENSLDGLDINNFISLGLIYLYFIIKNHLLKWTKD